MGQGSTASRCCTIAIGCLAAQPGCASVIAGAMSAEQVTANAAADWTPSPEELAEVDAITLGLTS